jgi:hypothetical protein
VKKRYAALARQHEVGEQACRAAGLRLAAPKLLL